jgi:hypothetical protein
MWLPRTCYIQDSVKPFVAVAGVFGHFSVYCGKRVLEEIQFSLSFHVLMVNIEILT